MVRKYLYLVIAVLIIGTFLLPLSGMAQEKSSIDQRITDLEQQLSVLKRQNEVDKEESSKTAKESLSVTASAKDGFTIRAADDSCKLKLSGWAQIDARIFMNNKKDSGITDTFLARTVRLTFSGSLANLAEFYISPEFAGSNVNLPDAYIDLKFWPALNIRGGKFKAPFGLERLQSTPNLAFAELALPSNLGPNRDIGFEIFGDLFKETVNYGAGIFNGVQDGATSITDTNKAKDFGARVFVQPFKHSDILSLHGFGFGGAVTYGHREDLNSALPGYKTSGQGNFFSYVKEVSADGQQVRYSPQFYYYNKSFGLLSEYIISKAEFVKTSNGVIDKAKFKNVAWQAATTYVLTGESASYKGVIPLHPFSMKDKQWGAFEVVARFSILDVDDKVFSSGFAKLSASASKADSWGIGVNWYLSLNARCLLNYEQTKFEEGGVNGGNRPAEHLVLSRIQLQF
jgi:phosphate-selective porin OprO and OprP